MNWDQLFDRPGPAKDYDDQALGPILRSDAALLGAVLNYIKPRVVVEYGSLDGHSTSVLARFAETVYAVEVDNIRPGLHHTVDANPNVCVCHMSMRDFVPPVGTAVDVAYFDASHELEDSRTAYLKIKPFLAPAALLIVHDTATWHHHPSEGHRVFQVTRDAAVRGERAFVNWVKEFDRWNPIAFATARAFRHGLTLLQKETGWDGE